MAKDFYARLQQYYLNVAKVLRGEADAASIFPNTTDLGQSRERVYAEFLRQHLPSRCNVRLGGYVFHTDGRESKQLDILVTTDTAPLFDFHNRDGGGKSFSPVEGTLGVVTAKSNLTDAELQDTLWNLASIPPTEPIGSRLHPLLKAPNYEDWPLKVVFALRGNKPATLLQQVNDFYAQNPSIPVTRRANFIHVAGSCLIARFSPGMQVANAIAAYKEGDFVLIDDHHPDVQALVWVIDRLQNAVTISGHMLYNYSAVLDMLVLK